MRVVPPGLATAAASGYAGPSASAARPQPPPAQPAYTSPAPGYTAAPPPAYTAGPAPSPAASTTAAAKPGTSACGVLVIVLGGLVLLGVLVAAAGYAWFATREPEPAGVLIPTIESGFDFPTAVIDPSAGGGAIEEPVLGTGDVQVTLRWNNGADLDLHVTDPSGEEIYFGYPLATSGGELDVDANAGCAGDPPVENVFWPTGGAPTGSYSVSVHYYGACESTEPANYVVTILVNGQEVNSVTGTLSAEQGTAFIGEFSR
jgi:hypothetical protein